MSVMPVSVLVMSMSVMSISVMPASVMTTRTAQTSATPGATRTAAQVQPKVLPRETWTPVQTQTAMYRPKKVIWLRPRSRAWMTITGFFFLFSFLLSFHFPVLVVSDRGSVLPRMFYWKGLGGLQKKKREEKQEIGRAGEGRRWVLLLPVYPLLYPRPSAWPVPSLCPVLVFPYF